MRISLFFKYFEILPIKNYRINKNNMFVNILTP